MSPSVATAIVVRPDDEAGRPPIFGMDYIRSLQLPSVFPQGATWFLSQATGSVPITLLRNQAGSVIYRPETNNHHWTDFFPPPSIDAWEEKIAADIVDANTGLILSPEHGVEHPPDSSEKFRHLGQKDIMCLITVATLPSTTGARTTPALICLGYPTVPMSGPTDANGLWRPISDTETIATLKPGNIPCPKPFSQAMLVVGSVSDIRGKKDAPFMEK